MRLIVEHEHVRRSAILGIGGGLIHLNRVDLKERLAEGFVDGNEGRCQSARAF